MESLERSISKIVPSAKEFSKPLVVRARDNSGGHTEGEKRKEIEGFKKKKKGKRLPLGCPPLNGSCYFERFRVLDF